MAHNRVCGTCAYWKQVNGRYRCSNPESAYYNHDNYYSTGKDCHTTKKALMATTSAGNDYIEYQKGCVKIKLQGGKMNLTLTAVSAFNEEEKNKVKDSLNGAFEVIQLAHDKIEKEKKTPSIGI